MRERWVEQQELLEGRKQWHGPCCFDARLLAQGGRTLDKMQDAEVCCRYAVFADFSCVQKW